MTDKKRTVLQPEYMKKLHYTKTYHKKGVKQAADMLGGELPETCQKTMT